MKEIINIHIGQAGVQIGNACWELFCREHNIQPDGTIDPAHQENSTHSSIFSLNSQEKYTPRSLFIDLDPTTIDEIRTGPYRKLFNPDFLISGKEDANNIFARGLYTVGRERAEDIETKIRKLAEACDNLGGFIFTHSISGGTGSGLFRNTIQKIGMNFPKKEKQCFTLFPSPDISNTVVEPYNAVLSAEALETAESVILLDNQAIYNLCSEHLNIESPYYTNVNRLIAQLISSSTLPMRFSGGSINTTFQEFHTNLVPYPDAHFLIPSLSPIIDINKAFDKEPSLETITDAAFEPKSSLFSCDALKGRYFACSMMYRGDITPKEVMLSVENSKMKKLLSLIDSVRTDVSAGVHPFSLKGNEDMRGISRSLCMLSNNTVVKKRFKKLMQKFELLWNKRGFVYWYVGEGMEEGEFYEQYELFNCLKANYSS